jgi:O-antigen/teichoic acid export membrane protein
MSNIITAKQAVLNIISQWILQIFNLVVTFFLIGYAIAKVGEEHYGGWASIMSIIAYLAVLDAGMTIAIQHYVAALSAKGERQKLMSLFSSAYIAYGIGAVAAALICLVISFWYHELFPKVSVSIAAECTVTLRWVAAGVFLFVLNLPMQGALVGLQRYYVRNTIELASLAVRVLTVVVLFNLFGFYLTYLGAAFFAATATRFVLSRVALHFIEPDLRLRPSYIRTDSLREIFSFGGHSFFWAISTVLVRDTGPILGTILIGPTAATYLYVGARLVASVGTFIYGAGDIFLPMASALKAANDNVRLQAALVRGTRFCAALAFPAAAVLLTFGQAILKHWVHSADFDYNTSYYVVVATTIGMFGTWVFKVPLAVLTGIKVLRPVTYMWIIRVAFGVPLGVAMGYYFGAVGVAAGLLTPILVTSNTWIPYKACHSTGITVGKLFHNALIGPLIVGAIVAAGALMIQIVWPAKSAWILITECAVILMLFLALVVAVGIDAASRKLILAKLSLR